MTDRKTADLAAFTSPKARSGWLLTHRLWGMFGLLMAILVVSGATAYWQVVKISGNVAKLVEIEEPLEEAVLEMEINAGEAARAVLEYAREVSFEHLDARRDADADFARYAAEFERLAETAEEKRLGKQVAKLHEALRVQGDEIVALSERRFALRQLITGNLKEIDELFEEEIHPRVNMKTDAGMMKQHTVFDMELGIFEFVAGVEGYTAIWDPDVRQEMEEEKAKYRRAAAAFRKMPLTGEEREAFERLDVLATAVLKAGVELIAVTDILTGRFSWMELLVGKIDTVLDEEIQPLIKHETVKAAAAARDAAQTALLVLVLLGVSGVLIGGATMWGMTRGIVGAVQRLVAGAERIGAGDTGHRMDTGTRDEFGYLAQVFNRTVERLEKAQSATAASEQRFKDITEATSDWIWEMGPDLRFTFFTGRIREILGVEPTYFLGKRREHRAVVDRDAEAWERHLDDLENRRPFRDFEYGMRRPDGSIRFIRISGKPIADENGDFAGYRGTGTDITAHKKAEQDLIAAKLSAESANQIKTDFLANMSHELRTPLNAVIGFSDVMKQELFGSLGNDKYRDYVEDINSSGQHLLELINDVLDVSAIEAGKLELVEEELDVAQVFESSVNLLSSQATDKEINLETNIDQDLPALYADERRLKQVLLNLLSNAIKFTPEGGPCPCAPKWTATGRWCSPSPTPASAWPPTRSPGRWSLSARRTARWLERILEPASACR